MARGFSFRLRFRVQGLGFRHIMTPPAPLLSIAFRMLYFNIRSYDVPKLKALKFIEPYALCSKHSQRSI